MNLPPVLNKKIAGVPAWAFGGMLVAALVFVAIRRRAAAAAADAEPEDDGLGYDGDIGLEGGLPGAGGGFYSEDGSSALLDGLDDLRDELFDRFDTSDDLLDDRFDELTDTIEVSNDSLGDRIEDGFEGLGETITEGFNGLNDVLVPDEDGDQGGNDGGGGDGQLPPPDPDPEPEPEPEPEPHGGGHGCPKGYSWNGQRCEKIETHGGGKGCGKGMTWDADKKRCVPILVDPKNPSSKALPSIQLAPSLFKSPITSFSIPRAAEVSRVFRTPAPKETVPKTPTKTRTR